MPLRLRKLPGYVAFLRLADALLFEPTFRKNREQTNGMDTLNWIL